MRSDPCVAALVLLAMLCCFTEEGGCRPNTGKSSVTDYSNDDDYTDNDIEYAGETGAETYAEPQGPPSILSKGGEVSGKPRDTVVLPCDLANGDATGTNWLRGDTLLFFGEDPIIEDDPRITRLSNNSLVVRGLTEDDNSVRYICRILTVPTQEIVYSLSVVVPPKLEVYPPGPVVVRQGGKNMDVTLQCRATWRPAPVIRWSRGGIRLTSDPTKGIEVMGETITIRNVSENQAGLYQCLAETPQSATSPERPGHASVEVIVAHAPRIQVERAVVHTGLGRESELICRIDSYPPATLSWFKDSDTVNVSLGKGTREISEVPTDAANSTTRTSKLFIENTSAKDLGKYECRATNNEGHTSGFIVLTGVPEVPRLTVAYRDDDKATPILEWTLRSYSPIIEYKLEYRRRGEEEWRTLNPAVVNGHGDTWVVRQPLKGLTPGDYEAILYAHNNLGWSGRPAEPQVFSGQNPDGTSSAAVLVARKGTTTGMLLLGLLVLLVNSSVHHRGFGFQRRV